VEEQTRLLDALMLCHAPHLRTLVPLLLLTGMRAGEAMSLTWEQVNLMERAIRVGRAKTPNGTGRVIPINDDLASTLAAHYTKFTKDFGEPLPDQYIFAWGSPIPADPTRPVSDVKHGWETVRELANVSCRLHDLRHTFATRLAENGVPESTMLALMGHMSRTMLERYSHIRMAAKRDAVSGVTLHSKVAQKGQNSEVVPVEVPVVKPARTIQ
jgi:integrase